MYYLLPFLFGIYYYRYTLVEFILRTISQIEINYNKWLKINYPHLGYKIYKNGNPIHINDDITTLTSNCNKQDIFEIEYIYNNKIYSVYGSEIAKLIEYVKNVNSIIENETRKKTRIYKWISAEDENNICVLEIIKKYSGPLGDFYKHFNIDVNSNYISEIKGKNIVLIDYNIDEYRIEPSSLINLT
jgi:hypothetical protein